VDRVGPRGHPDGEPSAEEARILLLEGGKLLSEDEPAALEHPFQRPSQLRLVRQELRAQITDRNHAILARAGRPAGPHSR